MRIISIGEILWDVYENEEHIGGAPFNFSVYGNRLGHKVYFISAVGEDKRGDKARNYDLSTKFVQKLKVIPQDM